MTSLLAALMVAPFAVAFQPLINVPRNLMDLPPFPEGITRGPDGNLYVSLISFTDASRILIVHPQGTIAGEIPVAGAPGQQQVLLLGLRFDQEGNLYVCDGGDFFLGVGNGRVLRISPEGAITTLASGLALPNDLAVDPEGSLFVTESGLGRVWKITIGEDDDSAAVALWSDSDLLKAHPPIPAGLPPAGANGIAFTREFRSLLVANTIDGTVVEIPVMSDGRAGTARVFATGVFGADGLALDVRGNVYVSQVFLNRITLLSPVGVPLETIEGTGDHAFRSPASLVFRGRQVFITNLTLFSGGNPGLSVMTARFPGLPLIDD